MKLNLALAFLCGLLAAMALGAQQQHLPRTAGVQLVKDVNALDPRSYVRIGGGKDFTVPKGKAFVLDRVWDEKPDNHVYLLVDDRQDAGIVSSNRNDSFPRVLVESGRTIRVGNLETDIKLSVFQATSGFRTDEYGWPLDPDSVPVELQSDLYGIRAHYTSTSAWGYLIDN